MMDLKDDELADDQLGIEALAAERAVYKDPCSKCGGSGIWFGWSGARGKCFTCTGRGYFERVTSPEERARRKEMADQRAAAKASTREEQFAAARPAEYEWLAKAGTPFSISLLLGVAKYGSLTERQLAAVQNLMAADAQRAQERAKRAQEAPVADAEPLMACFDAARSNGLKKPRIRLAGFRFSLASESSANAGGIYVKSIEGAYLGKVLGGRFSRSRECPADLVEPILEAVTDPKGAAIAYGKQFGQCAICSRELSDPASVAAGIGPICAGKFGW